MMMRYAMLGGSRVDIRSEEVFDRMKGYCPECGRAVQAFKGRNAPERGGVGQRFHFRHVKGPGNCSYDRVSPLHDFAQNCLVEAGGMCVPLGDGHGLFEGTGEWMAFGERPKMEYLIRGLEKGWRRVDVMVQSDGRSIAVEVTVTNGLSPSRVKSLKAMGHEVLEIDLSGYDHIDFDETEVRETVINGTSQKIWRREGDRRGKTKRGGLLDEDMILEQASSQTDLFEPAPHGFWYFMRRWFGEWRKALIESCLKGFIRSRS